MLVCVCVCVCKICKTVCLFAKGVPGQDADVVWRKSLGILLSHCNFVGKVVALVLAVSLVSARFITKPYSKTTFLSVLFDRSKSQKTHHRLQ